MNRMDMNDRMDREMDKLVQAPRQLDDSERNQLAELRHEACEAHCADCGECLGEGIKLVAVGPWGAKYEDVPAFCDFGDDGDGPSYCGECFHGIDR